MKQLNKTLLAGVLTVLLVAGCDTDDLRDLDIPPQAVNQINLNFLFTAAELGAASGGSSGDNRYIDWRTNIGFASYAIQHLANGGTGGIAPGDRYTENFETNNAPFEFLYGDQLKNLAEIIRQTGPGGWDEGKKNNLRQASRILRAFLFHRLTDYYGSVPYFEANKGVDRIFFPKYDKQKEIYADLLKELDEATAALAATNDPEGFDVADIIYDGDIEKWRKWGYALMLRLAMRVSNVDATMANTYVAKAAGKGFSSNDDNAWVPMALTPSEWWNQNGISRAFYPGDGGQPTFMSKTLIDWLKGDDAGSTADDDPRLMILTGGKGVWSVNGWAPTDVNPLTQKGMPNGMDGPMLNAYEGKTVVPDTEYSKINYLLLQRDDPYMLMNYGEVELLLAEAAERGIGGVTNAETHYNEGVKASMQMYTPYDETLVVSDAQVAAYLAAHPYEGTTEQKLEMIGEQLWVNKFMNWWEAWADWRRTGYPVLVPTNYPGNETNGQIPVRLRYPNAEVSGNPNFADGATQPNTFLTKVWWDEGPE
jgi:hypothetical protein